jgi:hypothetical protein
MEPSCIVAYTAMRNVNPTSWKKACRLYIQPGPSESYIICPYVILQDFRKGQAALDRNNDHELPSNSLGSLEAADGLNFFK